MGEGWCGTCPKPRQTRQKAACRKNWSRSSHRRTASWLPSTRPYSRSLLGVDFSVNCETRLSPPSLSLSPSPSSLLDLLGHPQGGGAVSHASVDEWGVAVKETTKSIVIDIDEVHEIRVRALLTGGLDQGPHITLKVGGAYSLNVP